MTPKKNDPVQSRWFGTAFRVRYQETDGMGVVYHANYLTWFEIGRTEMFRRLGYNYRDLEAEGMLLPVTSADLQFKSPARYDDLIVVFTRITLFTPLRLGYEYEVRRVTGDTAPYLSHTPNEGALPQAPDLLPGEVLVAGSTSHVWVNREWRPARLDKALPELYEAMAGALREERGSE